jgi:dTDP-4-dehydrorhamnose reductase
MLYLMVKKNYNVSDKTCPLNIYGKMKVEVEEFLSSKLKRESCILRLTKIIH